MNVFPTFTSRSLCRYDLEEFFWKSVARVANTYCVYAGGNNATVAGYIIAADMRLVDLGWSKWEPAATLSAQKGIFKYTIFYVSSYQRFTAHKYDG